MASDDIINEKRPRFVNESGAFLMTQIRQTANLEKCWQSFCLEH